MVRTWPAADGRDVKREDVDWLGQWPKPAWEGRGQDAEMSSCRAGGSREKHPRACRSDREKPAAPSAGILKCRVGLGN